MIIIPLQIQPGHKTLVVTCPQDQDALKTFKAYQIVQAKLIGHKRPRSVQQNAWIHAIFQLVADNTEDPNWNTLEKVKYEVKLEMKFFKSIIVRGHNVYHEFKSFAFDAMDQNEADLRYNEAKQICADKLGVDPEVLEVNARTVSF
jgi:hypothetical protein